MQRLVVRWLQHRALFNCQLKGVNEEGKRISAGRSAYSALEVTDCASAKPCSLSECLMRESCGESEALQLQPE